MQEQLLGHLVGALDDQEQEAVEARLKSDPSLRRELSRLRGRLEPLEAARFDFTPPPGLAERTCRLVAAEDCPRVQLPQFNTLKSDVLQPDASPPAVRQSRPAIESPSWMGGIRWVDVVVAATVFVAAALLTVPAIQHSRFNARLAACQNNLRELGLAMKQYAMGNGGFFPTIPTEGKPTGAGIYAPTLMDAGLLTDVRRVVCPSSSLADQEGFRIPSLVELRSASGKESIQLRKWMGGSYGNTLGYRLGGVYQDTKDLNRTYFVIMADAPNTLIPGYQSDNHGDGHNVMFEDGRVIFVISSRLGPRADDIFFNDDGKVEAGTQPNDSVIAPSSAMPIIWVKSGR